MRPYLAVLKDAFREAMSSWLLVIVLLLATAVLLGLSGFSLSTPLVRIAPQDFIDGGKVVEQLVAAGADDAQTPARRTWDLLTPAARAELQQAHDQSKTQEPKKNVVDDLLSRELNTLLERRDLYQSEYWKSANLTDEAHKLLDKGPSALSSAELAVLNRRLIDAAFPFQIRSASDPHPQFSYFFLPINAMPGVEPRQLVSGIVGLGMRWFIGIVGLIVAILVTASTIPQMFEPGAIDLLLSKPVSRVTLFLTRFLGGCVFVLVVSAYLVTGIWLLCGLRLGIWFPRMLGCIPLFVFLFMIYYTISALSGVIWRNAIVSVLLTSVFMLSCSVMENYRLIAETAFFDQTRIARLIQAKETLIAVERNGTLLAWNDAGGTWDKASFRERRENQGPGEGPPDVGGFDYPFAGPDYDPKGDRLVALQTTANQFGQFGQFGGSGKLLIGRRDEKWKGTTSISSDLLVNELFCREDGTIITVGATGLSRLEGDPSKSKTKDTPPLKLFGGALDFAQFKALNAGEAHWVPIGPPNISWMAPLSAAMHADGRIAIVDRDHVRVLKPGAEGRYEVQSEHKREKHNPALIAFAGETVAVVNAQGVVQLFEAANLTTPTEVPLLGDEKPRQVDLSADGKWLCVLSHARTVRLCDVRSGTPIARAVGGYEVSSIAFSGNTLLIADFYRRVTAYESGTWTLQKRYNPGFSAWEGVNFYVVYPLYEVLPKPGDLSDRWTGFFMDENKTPAVRGQEDDLTATRINQDLWSPLWSNAAFVGIMLALGSLYVWRKDF